MNKIKSVSFLIIGLLFSLQSFSQEMNYHWAQQYGHVNYRSDIVAVSSDNMNNIICFTHFDEPYSVEEYEFTSSDGDDLLIYSINEDGQLEWAISGGGADDQIAQKLVCDDDGNIYLMGKFAGQIEFGGEVAESNGSFDMYLIKLSATGEFLWMKTYGGPNSESFQSIDIYDKKITIAGRYYNYTVLENDTINGVDGTDFFAAQFNMEGELLQWVTFGGESVDYVSDVCSDIYGNIYLTGDFYQNLQIGEETLEAGDMLGVYILKLNANLEVEWVYQPEGTDLKPNVKIACDSYGNVSVAGNFSGTIQMENTTHQTADFDEDIFVAHFNTNGEFNWLKRFYSASAEIVTAFQMDRTGDIYMGGHYLNHIHFNDLVLQYNLCCGDPEIFFVKLDEEGEVLNSTQITGERSNLKDIYVPEVNQVIIAGQFFEHLQLEDFELESPTSYNVYVAYYKDDTWLFEDQKEMSNDFVRNSFSNHSFQLYNLENNSLIQIYNTNGQLIECIESHSGELEIGESWQKGLYIIQLQSENNISEGLKVLKL